MHTERHSHTGTCFVLYPHRSHTHQGRGEPKCALITTFLKNPISLLLASLVDERLVDVGDDAAARDGGLDQGVQLLVTPDGQLQVAGRDALDLRGRTSVGWWWWLRKSNRLGEGLDAPRLLLFCSDLPLSPLSPLSYLQVLGRVTGQLQDLGGEVLCVGGGGRWKDGA